MATSTFSNLAQQGPGPIWTDIQQTYRDQYAPYPVEGVFDSETPVTPWKGRHASTQEYAAYDLSDAAEGTETLARGLCERANIGPDSMIPIGENEVPAWRMFVPKAITLMESTAPKLKEDREARYQERIDAQRKKAEEAAKKQRADIMRELHDRQRQSTDAWGSAMWEDRGAQQVRPENFGRVQYSAAKYRDMYEEARRANAKPEVQHRLFELAQKAKDEELRQAQLDRETERGFLTAAKDMWQGMFK